MARNRHPRYAIAQCADCHGDGGYMEIIFEGKGPWFECGFCHGLGRTTRWMNGMIFMWRNNPYATGYRPASERRHKAIMAELVRADRKEQA